MLISFTPPNIPQNITMKKYRFCTKTPPKDYMQNPQLWLVCFAENAVPAFLLGYADYVYAVFPEGGKNLVKTLGNYA